MPPQTRRSKAAATSKGRVETESTLAEIVVQDTNNVPDGATGDNVLSTASATKAESKNKENAVPVKDEENGESKVRLIQASPESISVKGKSKVELVGKTDGEGRPQTTVAETQNSNAIASKAKKRGLPAEDDAQDANKRSRKSTRSKAKEQAGDDESEMESKRAKAMEEAKALLMLPIKESSMRSSPNGDVHLSFVTLEDLLSLDSPSATGSKVLRSGRKQKLPPVAPPNDAERNSTYPRTLANIRPTTAPKNNASSSKKVAKVDEAKDPREYCHVLTPTFFECILCGTDFDLEALGQSEYDTEEYDKHAKTRAHRKKVAELDNTGRPPITTSIPREDELKTYGRVQTEPEAKTKSSSRKRMVEAKEAVEKIYNDEFCYTVDEGLVQCRLCKFDMAFNHLLGTDTKEWNKHLETEVHKKKVAAYRRKGSKTKKGKGKP